MTPSKCADSRTNSKTDKNGQKRPKNVMCHMSCHLSLMPTATATNPPPAKSPITDSRLVCKRQKEEEKVENAKNHQNEEKKNREKMV